MSSVRMTTTFGLADGVVSAGRAAGAKARSAAAAKNWRDIGTLRGGAADYAAPAAAGEGTGRRAAVRPRREETQAGRSRSRADPARCLKPRSRRLTPPGGRTTVGRAIHPRAKDAPVSVLTQAAPAVRGTVPALP